MIQFNQDRDPNTGKPSGLYLASTTDRAHARVAFLFQDTTQTPPSFQLTEKSWISPNTLGFFAFFVPDPSNKRDWKAFAAGVRSAFEKNKPAQLGWFPEPLGTPQPTLVLVSGQGSAAPALSQVFSVVFSRTLTCQLNPKRPGPTTVLFKDASNSIVFDNLLRVELKVSSASGSGNFTAPGPVSVPLTDALAGSATLACQLNESQLRQFEAGVMFFSQKQDSPVQALRYPTFRARVGTSAPFNLQLSLDALSPLDVKRTYFRFTDAVLGSYFATSMGRPLALRTVGGNDIDNMSRLVFAVRPVRGPTDSDYYYLTPAGQFPLAPDGAGPQAARTAPVQMLCGVTGTEYLRVDVGADPDAIQFVPGNNAWQITPNPSSTDPVYLDNSATTSWAKIVTTFGAYISQPERSPLFSQKTNDQAPVHVLNFNPTNSWRPHESAALATPVVPLVPYAGLNFAIDPNLKIDQYRQMEAEALNPTRAHTLVPVGAMHARHKRIAADADSNLAMTPQGMLVGLKGDPPIWDSLQIAISNAVTPILEFDSMGPSIQAAVQKNQIFAVISTDPKTTTDPVTGKPPLFLFDDRYLEIGDWTFDLSPAGLPAPDEKKTPPIFIMKFYPGKSIEDLIAAPSLWSQPDTFNVAHPATEIQQYLQGVIQAADEADDELYENFLATVRDPNFSGILVVNCNIQLDSLPAAIKAVLGGMKVPGIAAFRAHHVGIAINDTDPDADEPTLAKSSMFGLVDYEGTPQKPTGLWDYEVEYLRALFINSELRSFACKVNLYIFQMFMSGVSLEIGGGGGGGDDDDNKHLIVVMGSYQSQGGDDDSSGEGVYSFISDKTYTFDFATNKYLDNIALTKLQFSFDREEDKKVDGGTTTATISSHFGIWGIIKFKELDVLDIFSIDQLAFSELAIDVSFKMTINPPNQPSILLYPLSFEPGNLRLDLGATKQRSTGTSLLKLLPFKLKSFLYSQKADATLESLNYYGLGGLPGFSSAQLLDTFNYALVFDLDLGSMGGLVATLSAFKFSILIGWKAGDPGIAFGVQMPEANGKLEIKIEGVLTISIEQFTLVYAKDTDPKMLVLGMQNCYFEVLGKRLPPGEKATFSIGLFAPTEGADQIGWIGAYNKGEDGGGGEGDGNGGGGDGKAARRRIAANDGNGNGGSKVFELDYLGLGQRVGPASDETPTDFDGFLDFMKHKFWDYLKDKEFDKISRPEGKWIALTHFTLLEKIELGLIFYDTTPFYSLQLKISAGKAKGLEFEIIYTKVTDSIGLFAAKLGLPDSLRTFQAGAASITLPTIGIDIYTNGNWKADLGYPDGDDWSVCFRVEAQAGPVPVVGYGGFYVASLSSATDPDVFKGNYPSILAFGLAARLGVGKDFTSGPLKAGVSITFFGIIQGAVGYLTDGGFENIFSEPDALALQGQFGLIGEIYGSIDFVIISASVNVRLEASVGIILAYEPHVPAAGDGSVLLYVEASVSVSVTVSIDLGLFTIHIGFSFDASFRFQWQLAGPSSQSNARALFVAQARIAHRVAAPRPVRLCPGLPANLPLPFLPEFTVVFPASGTGVPWFVASLGLEYDNTPKADPKYADFKPFEALATQFATFALVNALNLADYRSPVWLESDPNSGRLGLRDIDSEPDLLTGWIDYPAVLSQLKQFQATLAVPTGNPGDQIYMTAFPMPPFVNLATSGRLNSAGQAEDFSYQFQTKNAVPTSYMQQLDVYFNQLFVNRTSESSHVPMFRARAEDADTPLVQEIFLDYFKGLIRATVHQLLVTLEEQIGQPPSSALDDLFIKAVGATHIKAAAGQMASIARGGARLPLLNLTGITIPDGQPQSTNPVYALLWQEFPVGGFAKTSYTVTLSNPDSSQPWLSGSAVYTITNDNNGVAPFTGLQASQLTVPSTPTPIPQTQVGPQSFPFRNAIVWTRAETPSPLSLRPFAPNLARLQISEGDAISVLVKSRQTGGAYLPDGKLLNAGDVTFATTVNLTVKQIPGAAVGSLLKDVFALSGASQADEALLGRILAVLKPPSTERRAAAIRVLYPTPGQLSGLTSAQVDPDKVFVLRTNTTTVSQPPQGVRAMAQPDLEGVAVAANLDLSTDGGYGFLQIIQQATVTNAPGYYLRYIDTAGNSLDPNLFNRGPATLALVVTYKTVGSNTQASPLKVEPYYNSIAIANANTALLYYAETTDTALATRYVALAVGTAGVELDRSDGGLLITPSAELAAALGNDSTPRPVGDLIARLRARGVTDPTQIRNLLVGSGSAIARLNALYGLVAYQIQATSGFDLSNLSAPVQSQKPTHDATISAWRVVAPLYSVANVDPGNRYAGIDDPFALSLFVTDAFGNQLPSPQSYSSTNYYFDPIIPLDQWQGILPSYDFSGQANIVTLHLAPKISGFADLAGSYSWSATTVTATTATPHRLSSGDRVLMIFTANTGQAPANGIYQSTPTGPGSFTVATGASGSGAGSFGAIRQDPAVPPPALALYRTIYDQITGPGVSFQVETNLALQADGSSLVAIPLSQADITNIKNMVNGIIGLLAGTSTTMPALVDISVTVSGAGTLPPLFQLAVLFGIERDLNLVAPGLRGTFPSAHTVSTTVLPVTAIVPPAKDIGTFAQDFTAAFPPLNLALGMTGGGTATPQLHSKTARARRRLKALGLPNDGTGGGGRAGEQPLWAVAASLLDVSIGTGSGSGPRFLAPKPLDNVLNSGTVPLPVLEPPLRSLPIQQTFVDVDLDQINRVFFQAVDNVLSPASAAKAYEVDPDSYAAIAIGREIIAQKYSTFEVDWLFPAGSPFTGNAPQATTASKVFEQQMRAALMTAYSVDTIVQYDVTWNRQISSQADGYIELFGQVEATLSGTYVWSGTKLMATTKTPHGLSVEDPPVRVLMMFAPSTGQPPVNGVYSVTASTTYTFTIDMGANGSGSGNFSGVRQNAGLSTAHVAANSKGASLLTFLYGNPDVASASTDPFDLRFNVTHLQHFLAPDDGSGGARPSIWVQLVNPVQPHVGPAGALTVIPVVLRQYPTSPTFVGQSWAPFTPNPSGNPIADEADWSYIFTYQAVLADQDQINAAITYNTDLRPPGGKVASSADAHVVHYTLFQALARFTAVNSVVGTILPNYDTADPATWTAAVKAFAASLGDVVGNSDWIPLPAGQAVAQPLVKLTDNYVITDKPKSKSDPSTRLITLQWLPPPPPPPHGLLSSFPSAKLSVKALDPKNTNFPDPSSAYPNQGPVTSPPPPDNAAWFQVSNAAPDPLIGIAHRVQVDGLNVLAAENAIAGVQIERNLITLVGPDGKPYQVVREFIYTTALVRPSQPLTPYIDSEPTEPPAQPNWIDVANLQPRSPGTLYQRIYNVIRDLLADAVQARALRAAHRAAGVTTGTMRRLKVACSYQFPVAAVAGATDTKISISPLVPVVMARSFDIDGQDAAALSSFATLFAAAIAGWAHDNALIFGPKTTLKPAALRFDITLYAKLSGLNTPVLRLNNLQLKLTDIDPVSAPAGAAGAPADTERRPSVPRLPSRTQRERRKSRPKPLQT